MVYYEIHPETGGLFVSVPNTKENKNLLTFLETTGHWLSDRHINWNSLIKGPQEALETAFHFEAGSLVLKKLKRRYTRLVWKDLNS